MKKLSSFLFLGIVIFTVGVTAQNLNYPIKIVNGVEYYIYSVETSEGLFAIARKFKVNKSDIENANPDLKSGIKPGQKLLIPAPKTEPKQTASKSNINSTTTNTTVEFVHHKVENKQTLFAISRKYNVNQDLIKKYNPTISNGLIEGTTLMIPIVKNTKEINEPSKNITTTSSSSNNSVLIHKVQAGETLYSISKKYDIGVDDLIKQNPTASTKLSAGSELKIIKAEQSGTIKESNSAAVATSSESSFELKNLLDKSALSKWKSKKQIKIAFLLPFMLDKPKGENNVDRFIEFYSGALLAIEGWKKKGVSFEIYTFDTDNSIEKMNEVLLNSEIKTMDLLVGPAFSNQVSLVAAFAKENQINTLIPFTSKVNEIDSNPYLYQFNPGLDVETKFVTDLLVRTKDANIIFAEIEGISTFDEGNLKFEALKVALKKSKKNYVSKLLSSLVATDFTNDLKKGSKNIIIFNSDKYSSVSPYLPAVRTQVNNFDITLFGQNSWRNQNIMLPSVKFISPFITNSSSALVDFNEMYVRLLKKDITLSSSPRYDVLGYDLSNYFITLINRYGNDFNDKLSSFKFTNGIQSQPEFERNSNKEGFLNQKLYLFEDNAVPTQVN